MRFKMKKKSFIIVIFVLIFLISFVFVIAENYQAIQNPWTGKLDYVRGTNWSSYNRSLYTNTIMVDSLIAIDTITATNVTVSDTMTTNWVINGSWFPALDNTFFLGNITNMWKTIFAHELNSTMINGNSTWQHQSYPVACPENSSITELGDSVTCTVMTGMPNSHLHNAVNITSGTFGAGNFVFPDNLSITNRVGIGTTLPTSRLEVFAPSGDTVLSQFTGTLVGTNIGLQIKNNATSNTTNKVSIGMQLLTNTSTVRWATGLYASFSNNTDVSRTGLFEIQVPDNTVFATRFAIAGNKIGINTTTPSQVLDVIGNINVTGNIINPTASKGIELRNETGDAYCITMVADTLTTTVGVCS